MSARISTQQVQRGLTVALLVCLALALAGRTTRRRLIGPERIDPALLQEPIQGETAREEFSLSYRGETYAVRPVASYELWGLVVSHNDPTALYDIYHDRNSVDTRDLGVIWGDNLRTDDYQRVRFRSVSFMLQWRYPRGVSFDAFSAGNNHLITDSDEVRRQIARVRVNDQVHLRGLLVDYAAASHPDWWRSTSRTRNDDGANACEVVFVEELTILRRGRVVEHAAWDVGKWVVLALLVGKAGLLLATLGGPRPRKLLRRPPPA